MTLPDKVEPGQELNVQIAPFGEFELHDGNEAHEGIVQKVDEAAVDAVVANFDGEVLVDVDHESCEGKTEAAAWVTSLSKDPERGLMARFRFTKRGAELVTDRAYRFTSPVWFLGEGGRPVKLDSVALTNRPNLPVDAVLNARVVGTPFKNENFPFKNAPSGFDGQGDGFPADASEGRFSQSEENNERKARMEEIKTLLGLPPEATDAEVADAVKALQTKVDELSAAAENAEAEKFAEENKDKGLDAEVLKNAYLASPDVAKTLVANMKATPMKTAPAAPVCNSATAVAPDMKAKPVKNEATIPCRERIAANRRRVNA